MSPPTENAESCIISLRLECAVPAAVVLSHHSILAGINYTRLAFGLKFTRIGRLRAGNCRWH